MKKSYMKPVVVLENFAMSTHIAGDCELKPVGPTQGSCAYLGTGGIGVFGNGIQDCEYKPTQLKQPSDDAYDGFCYHVPTETNNMFNS